MKHAAVLDNCISSTSRRALIIKPQTEDMLMVAEGVTTQGSTEKSN